MMRKRALILGAAGSVGPLLARQLHASDYEVFGLDLRRPESSTGYNRFIVDDAVTPTAESLKIIADVSYLIVCLPHVAGMKALSRSLQTAPVDCLVLDVLPAKVPVAELVQSISPRCQHLSLSLLFGPSLGFAGQRVVAIKNNGEINPHSFLDLVRGWGASIEWMSAEDHDRASAITQVAVHLLLIALGQILPAGHQEIQKLISVAPPPALVCLGLLSRMVSAAPEAYWDIQSPNPFARQARAAVIKSITDLSAMVNNDDIEKFNATFRSLHESLAGSNNWLNQIGADSVSSIPSQGDRVG